MKPSHMIQRQTHAENVVAFPHSGTAKGEVRRKRKNRRDPLTHIAEMVQLRAFIEDVRRWDIELKEFEKVEATTGHYNTAGFIPAGKRLTGRIPTKQIYDLYRVWIDGEDDEGWGERKPNGPALSPNAFGEVMHMMGFKRSRVVDPDTGKRTWCRKIPAAVNMHSIEIRVPVLERAQMTVERKAA